MIFEKYFFKDLFVCLKLLTFASAFEKYFS